MNAGATGASLAEKVQEAYAFIAQCVSLQLPLSAPIINYHCSNYQTGDEVCVIVFRSPDRAHRRLAQQIFLFGFSRGAYTARMVAAFIASYPVWTVFLLYLCGDRERLVF